MSANACLVQHLYIVLLDLRFLDNVCSELIIIGIQIPVFMIGNSAPMATHPQCIVTYWYPRWGHSKTALILITTVASQIHINIQIKSYRVGNKMIIVMQISLL